MASVMMELTEEARAHMFGPWNPYFHVTKVLIATMDRVRIEDKFIVQMLQKVNRWNLYYVNGEKGKASYSTVHWVHF